MTKNIFFNCQLEVIAGLDEATVYVPPAWQALRAYFTTTRLYQTNNSTDKLRINAKKQQQHWCLFFLFFFCCGKNWIITSCVGAVLSAIHVRNTVRVSMGSAPPVHVAQSSTRSSAAAAAAPPGATDNSTQVRGTDRRLRCPQAERTAAGVISTDWGRREVPRSTIKVIQIQPDSKRQKWSVVCFDFWGNTFKDPLPDFVPTCLLTLLDWAFQLKRPTPPISESGCRFCICGGGGQAFCGSSPEVVGWGGIDRLKWCHSRLGLKTTIRK